MLRRMASAPALRAALGASTPAVRAAPARGMVSTVLLSVRAPACMAQTRAAC
jgi:hypothetical protein